MRSGTRGGKEPRVPSSPSSSAYGAVAATRGGELSERVRRSSNPPRSVSQTERRAGYRDQLGRTVGSAAVPYGYTLSIWGGGSAAIHAFGPPSLIDVLLFVAGGAMGFLATEILARVDIRPRLPAPEPPPPMAGWGAVQLLPAGVSVLAAAAATELLGDRLAWPAAGFLVTIAYLMLSALQAALSSRAH